MKLTKAEIQEIIDYEVVVDCYDDGEVNMGWAIYMDENIYYPFEAESAWTLKMAKDFRLK